jgi:hypothetical protein
VTGVGVQRLAVLAAGLAVASGVVGCGGSEKPRLPPAPSPATAASQSALAVHGALEGDLVPRGSATCTSNDVSLFGTVGKTKVSLTVFAPFAYYPGNDTISLPAPSGVDIGIRLDADRGDSP